MAILKGVLFRLHLAERFRGGIWGNAGYLAGCSTRHPIDGHRSGSWIIYREIYIIYVRITRYLAPSLLRGWVVRCMLAHVWKKLWLWALLMSTSVVPIVLSRIDVRLVRESGLQWRSETFVYLSSACFLNVLRNFREDQSTTQRALDRNGTPHVFVNAQINVCCRLH
jgi:hypothetical protein